MFGMFPFMYNNNDNNNNYNNYNNGVRGSDSFFSLLSGNFVNNVVDQILSNDKINDIFNEMFEEDNYDVNIKDYGDYYLIKGYLPGVGPKDVNIDFEKNKAILTIKRRKRRNYSNENNNFMVTIMQNGMDVVKTFYIEEIDVTKLKATFDNNVLLLTLPKLKKPISENVKKNVNNADDDEPTIIDVENYKVE